LSFLFFSIGSALFSFPFFLRHGVFDCQELLYFPRRRLRKDAAFFRGARDTCPKLLSASHVTLLPHLPNLLSIFAKETPLPRGYGRVRLPKRRYDLKLPPQNQRTPSPFLSLPLFRYCPLPPLFVKSRNCTLPCRRKDDMVPVSFPESSSLLLNSASWYQRTPLEAQARFRAGLLPFPPPRRAVCVFSFPPRGVDLSFSTRKRRMVKKTSSLLTRITPPPPPPLW